MRQLCPGTPQRGLKPSERIDIEAPPSPQKKQSTELDSLASLPKTTPSGPAIVPVRVFRDETVRLQSQTSLQQEVRRMSLLVACSTRSIYLQEIGVRLGTNPGGDLQFTVTDTVEEAQDAARALQVIILLS